MNTKFRRLVFAVLLLSAVALQQRAARAGSFQENWCYCFNEHAYLYYIHPTLGPWIFIDEVAPSQWDTYFEPGSPGADLCINMCASDVVEFALDLCDDYSYDQQHYQVLAYWHFEDADDDSWGTEGGILDSGSGIYMCPN